ncbi:MAG: hypothetical protein A2Z21_00890 [Candidatus Fraserbacteria bacterium RBG_16_55_9]|uniref:Uncharacterized protein n=1 Tax=Fraserbacteria sp. (strain RBG_16_55_9) TaxID=1817864 RepID=A0A1F5V2W5_FRAXR|nr:MAG: hypothetical protein A2Z21_00890 [Candidatus Fraserbacteria bacterium RBG_16_55_9]
MPRAAEGDTQIDIDLSGQLGRFDTETVMAAVACPPCDTSSGRSIIIIISGQVKQTVRQELQGYFRVLRRPELALYVAGLCILIQRTTKSIPLDRGAQFLIDNEFSGKEREIRGRLLNYIRTIDPGFAKERIVFGRMGRNSPAYKIARAGRRARAEGSIIGDAELISAEQLLTVLGFS